MAHCSAGNEGVVVSHDGEGAEEERTTLLLGNPNVGKSVLFKNLTHRYVTVSNYPGTTVEVVRARARFNGRETQVVDTPGINDLEPRSDDARVTVEVLEQHRDAVIVQVADAKNLRRALLLTLQLAERGRPMVLVLNMFDELEERGGRIDTRRLSEILGVPVVTTVAPRNQGTSELIEALPAARAPRIHGPLATGPAPAGAGRSLPDVRVRVRSRRHAVCPRLPARRPVQPPDVPELRVRVPRSAAWDLLAAGVARAKAARGLPPPGRCAAGHPARGGREGRGALPRWPQRLALQHALRLRPRGGQ
ncbi:MAG: 50S ribosome-binding GTPase [Gemmatimonadetes bacterium]|nr:50S ribosome-binding GTPase [Gemmatimonadota bacterium]